MRSALIVPILLAGCAGQPQLRQPAAVEVNKIVTVRCIDKAPSRPTYATESLAPTATDIQYGDALALDWVASRSYERELEIGIAACIK